MEQRDDTLSTRDIAGTTTPGPDEETGRFQRGGGSEAVEQDADTTPTGAPLMPADDSTDLRTQWESIQVTFVDEPRGAVERADQLVATVMQRIADGFATERSTLENQWSRGEDVSTEDLRVAMQRYRSFFERLLSA